MASAALSVSPSLGSGALACSRTTSTSSSSSAAVRVRVSGLRSSVALFPGAASLRASAPPARQAVAPATVCKVKEGDPAPSFTLKDQNGRSVSLNKFRGKNVVLYFYPADETPGCTKQACSFRDSYSEFKRAGAEVVGISKDSPESHKAFAQKYNLPYTLLSDEDNAVRKEFGVPADLFGILAGRQTYVLDKKGIVKLIYNNQFQPEKHVNETLSVLA